MILITKEENAITLKGHAGYAERGKDIVCAAVSMLVFNLQESINRLTEDTVGFCFATDETVISYGVLSANAQLLMYSFIIGLELLSQNYPDNVRIDRA